MIIILVFFLVCSKSSANYLNLKTVIDSSLEHYPMVIGSIQEAEAAKMKWRESQGSLDFNLKAKSDFRTEGFYDGKSMDMVLEKPLGYLNSSIYSGYKISDGSYPSYEGKVETLDGGEWRVGFALSLLQNRDIDYRRLKIKNDKISYLGRLLDVDLIKIYLIREATKNYWEWVAKGKIYKVYENLLSMSLSRDSAIQKRVSKGDLARIYVTENQQYIMKRKTDVIQMLQEFKEASLKLSMYYRNENGNRLIPDLKMVVPSFGMENKISDERLKNDIRNALHIAPDLKQIDYKMEQLENKEKFGFNKILPKVDFQFESSRDYGNGSDSLRPTENRSFIKIEIPLEQNLGRGKMYQARAQKRVAEFKKKLTVDKMNIQISRIFYRLNATVEIIENTDKEVLFAQKLQRAEIKKFSRGASDFFVVNLRDQNMADAKIKNIKAHLNYQKAKADYEAATYHYMIQSKK